MKHLSWLVTVPITAIVVIFAVANRMPVEIDLFPLPWSPVLPAYLLVLGSLFLGFLVGAGVAWLAAGPKRRRLRRRAAAADALAREVDELRRRETPTPTAAPPAATLPAAPVGASSLPASRSA